jgi:hypothetical protein
MNFALFLSFLLVSPAAEANTSSATAPLGMKKFEENTEVTDPKLKADEGSLSRLSLRFNLSYSGPPVGDLSAREQPNPDGTVSVTATAITGSAGLRYRFDSQRSISLTTGLSNQYPFREGSRFDANNPYFSYSRAFRIGDLQLISTPGFSIITAQKLTAVNQVLAANYSLSSVYNLGESIFAAGLDGTFSYFFFDEPYQRKDGRVRRSAFSASPTFKANVTKRLNLFTSVTFAFWNPRSGGSQVRFQQNTVSGKVGFGYAITRDIYISPYLGYFPGDPSWKSTSLNMSTVFSVL